MKVLYAPEINGLHSVYTIELIKKLIEETPQYFENYELENYELIDDSSPSFWNDPEQLARNGLFRIGNTIYSLYADRYYEDLGKAFRIDPIIHDLFKKFAREGFKIVDIPDDIEWYISIWDSGHETIHEKHRIWD